MVVWYHVAQLKEPRWVCCCLSRLDLEKHALEIEIESVFEQAVGFGYLYGVVETDQFFF